MIERLFPREHDFGGEKRREMEQEILKIRETLSATLTLEGQKLLDHLQDAWMRESGFEIRDAFTQGFCDGMELMLEYYARQGKS